MKVHDPATLLVDTISPTLSLSCSSSRTLQQVVMAPPRRRLGAFGVRLVLLSMMRFMHTNQPSAILNLYSLNALHQNCPDMFPGRRSLFVVESMAGLGYATTTTCTSNRLLQGSGRRTRNGPRWKLSKKLVESVRPSL